MAVSTQEASVGVDGAKLDLDTPPSLGLWGTWPLANHVVLADILAAIVNLALHNMKTCEAFLVEPKADRLRQANRNLLTRQLRCSHSTGGLRRATEVSSDNFTTALCVLLFIAF